jgi:methionine-rich copper-binding protein CopC
MKRVLVIAAAAGMLAFPASALAHAALLRTIPAASGEVDTPPRFVGLV